MALSSAAHRTRREMFLTQAGCSGMFVSPIAGAIVSRETISAQLMILSRMWVFDGEARDIRRRADFHQEEPEAAISLAARQRIQHRIRLENLFLQRTARLHRQTERQGSVYD